MRNIHPNIEGIFKKYYKELCFISLHYVNNLEEAEDVVQEVFVKLISKNKFIEIQNYEAYLRIAVRNSSLRSLEKSQKNILLNEEYYNIEEDDISDEEINQLEMEARLYQQINKLPKTCQKAFLYCAIDGLTYQEAADKMDISINTVKTHIKKAYKILRESFGSMLLSMISSKTDKQKSYFRLFIS